MNNLLQGLNVYLIGMMGSGKSTVGKILGDKLKYRFFDTDILIERITQKKIPDIFADDGESKFRDLETQVLEQLSLYTRSLIATGGGIVQRKENWGYLRQGLIIWLDTDIEVLKQRISNDHNRPLVGKLESLMEKRLSLYSQADLRIAIDNIKTPEDIATEIVDRIPSIIKTH